MVPSGPFFLSSNSLDYSLRKFPQWYGILKTKARKGNCLHSLFPDIKLPEKGKQDPIPCLTGGQWRKTQKERCVEKWSCYLDTCVSVPLREHFHQKLFQNCLAQRLTFFFLPLDWDKVQDSSSSKLTTWKKETLKCRVCVTVHFTLCSFVSINSWIGYQWIQFWRFHIKSRYVAFLLEENKNQTLKILNLYCEIATLRLSCGTFFRWNTCLLVSHRTQYP